ncbi:MAG: VTC domain-containing protein [Planctomycetota bacterium]|nr:VTC domain-containing protein [Planctomycetota bacterium]
MSKDLRYEVKMVAQAAFYPKLRMHMRLDRSAIRQLYPPRRIQSVYFDTHTGQALEENLAGISHREKVRLRWYGSETLGVQATLERKVRENMLGWKELLKIAAPVDVEGVPRRAFRDALRPHLTAAWNDLMAKDMLPVQWVVYDREYYATEAATGPIRITIDRALRTYDQRNRRSLSSRFRSPVPDVMIVEAKCADSEHAELKQLMDRFPMQIDRCSKFVYASSPNDGAISSYIPL